MISWISGELLESWQTNQKFFVLINCQGLGYEIQILETFFLELKKNQISYKNLTLWIKHIKKEDKDLLFGFASKDQRNFFVEILSVRGIGSQMGMGILNKFSISDFILAISTQNKKLICSIPGIGPKMAERLILELKNNFKNELQIDQNISKVEILNENTEINKILDDLQLTLKSLNYNSRDIDKILPYIVGETDSLIKKEKDISFEKLLKLAINYLDNDSSNIVR